MEFFAQRLSISRPRRVALAVLLLGVAAVGVQAWRYTSALNIAEDKALEMVRVRGYFSTSFDDSLLSRLCYSSGWSRDEFPPGVALHHSVGFPRNELTDAMVMALLNVRDLRAIKLYPAGPKIDWDASVEAPVQSLQDLELPSVSIELIDRLESRFKQLQIISMQPPQPNASTK